MIIIKNRNIKISLVVSMRMVPFVRPRVIFFMGLGMGPRALDEIEVELSMCDCNGVFKMGIL